MGRGSGGGLEEVGERWMKWGRGGESEGGEEKVKEGRRK